MLITQRTEVTLWRALAWDFGIKCLELFFIVVSQNYGYPFEGAHNKDYRILGLYWGPPILGHHYVSLWALCVVLLAIRDPYVYIHIYICRCGIGA